MFKRLTRSGDFCSDEHRKLYQSQYDELALSRLLQTRPAQAQAASQGGGRQQSAVLSATAEAPPVKMEKEPAKKENPAARQERAAPPSGGYLKHFPAPRGMSWPPSCFPALDLQAQTAAMLPRLADRENGATHLSTAPRVLLLPPHWAESNGGAMEAAIEARDFARAAPVLEIAFDPPHETALESMGSLMRLPEFPMFAPGDATLWQGDEVAFPPLPAESGDLIRPALTPLGWDPPRVEPVPEAPVRVERIRDEPERVNPVFLARSSSFAPSPAPAEAIPDPVTRPLPVTLHGIAPGRGKVAQVFTSALVRTPELPFAPTGVLPLRPVMTLGPAPAEAAASSPQGYPAPVQPSAPAGAQPPRVLAPLAVPYSSTDLGLADLSKPRRPVAVTVAIAVALLAALAGSVYVAMRNAPKNEAVPSGPVLVEAGPPLSSAEAGWIADWVPDPIGLRRNRRISVLRTNAMLTDYRMELSAQIDNKALAWVFRAVNPQNFYVEKLEVVKPGPDPTVALVRFAVIDGLEQPREQHPLPTEAHLDTVYKVRFEAVGPKFTTWVQGQRVDEWTDSRITTGGIGLYNERGESANILGSVSLVPLVWKRPE